MRLSTFKKILSELDILKFQLPDGHFVPPHFHITEVGNINRNYIDCGGVLRQEKKINLQLWVASDIEHRLKRLHFSPFSMEEYQEPRFLEICEGTWSRVGAE